MSIENYLEKLRSKPRRERERIAVFATAISFLIVFLIWLASFSDENQPLEESESFLSSPGNQFQDIKNSLGNNHQSIEEMIKDLSDFQDSSLQDAGNLNQSQPTSKPQDSTGSKNNDQSDQLITPQLP